MKILLHNIFFSNISLCLAFWCRYFNQEKTNRLYDIHLVDIVVEIICINAFSNYISFTNSIWYQITYICSLDRTISHEISCFQNVNGFLRMKRGLKSVFKLWFFIISTFYFKQFSFELIYLEIINIKVTKIKNDISLILPTAISDNIFH